MSEWDSQFKLRAGIYTLYIPLLSILPTNNGYSIIWVNETNTSKWIFPDLQEEGENIYSVFLKMKNIYFFHSSFFLIKQRYFCFDSGCVKITFLSLVVCGVSTDGDHNCLV